MAFPLWFQIAAGILTAEIVIFIMKSIKNRICDGDTDYYSSMPLNQMQELTAQNTRDMVKLGGFGLIFIVVYIIVYTWLINSM